MAAAKDQERPVVLPPESPPAEVVAAAGPEADVAGLEVDAAGAESDATGAEVGATGAEPPVKVVLTRLLC